MLLDADEAVILQRIDLDKALENLSVMQRMVLTLRLQGYSQQEVAEKVGRTRAAVASIHRQAIENLKQEMNAP